MLYEIKMCIKGKITVVLPEDATEKTATKLAHKAYEETDYGKLQNIKLTDTIINGSEMTLLITGTYETVKEAESKSEADAISTDLFMETDFGALFGIDAIVAVQEYTL